MLFASVFPGTPAAAPWCAADALGLPDWLHLSGSHRTRYEALDGQFRAGRGGSDQMVALRTILLTEVRAGALRSGIEIIDSRAYLDDSGTPVSTTMINPLELLQGYVAWDATDLIADGDRSTLRAGRLTIDVGSRRLVARSLYRNTINTFTGIEWQWQGDDGRYLQAFYTLPVNRKPNTAQALIDNDIEFDEEDDEVRFWGLLYRLPAFSGGDRLEFYLLGLDESDAPGRPGANRELYMPAMRLWREPAGGRFDYVIESVFQFGESRASAASTRDLDHFAHFQHAELGYSFDAPWAPRLAFQYDYASGDDDPSDGDNERFDTLFGARRFEFGPTGIYGPFIRRNLNTPGLRLQLKPGANVKLFTAWRGYWLASDRDAWVTARLQDASGDSGSFIGHQVEARLRWEVVPGSYRFEAGVAHLFDGEFMRDAPNANGEGDTTYFYSQALFRF